MQACYLGQTFSRKSATASEVSRFSLSCSARLRASYWVDPGTACIHTACFSSNSTLLGRSNRVADMLKSARL